MKDKNKNSLHLSFDVDNLAVPEIHVEHGNAEGSAGQPGSNVKVPKEILDYYSADQFAVKRSGVKIEEASKNYSRCSLQVTEEHRNREGVVAGGALFTLADFSFAVAAGRKRHYAAALTGEIRFMANMKGDVLYSECRVVRDSGRICFADVVITDKTGTAVASVSFSGMHLSVKTV